MDHSSIRIIPKINNHKIFCWFVDYWGKKIPGTKTNAAPRRDLKPFTISSPSLKKTIIFIQNDLKVLYFTKLNLLTVNVAILFYQYNKISRLAIEFVRLKFAAFVDQTAANS
jgi:hypothetical protein